MPLLRNALTGLGAAIALTAGALAQEPADAPAQGRAIIVLDGSGSMWGQIDGVPKITIARETLSGVLADAPDRLQLGLMAYGHRQKGVCSDIELLVPPGPAPQTADAILSAAGGITPRGKTPISDAVQLAADSLRYTEDRATVILVTDGIETCDADPCAVADELERLGVDFTAHVVGFGLSAQEGERVACLAENTGGEYIEAADAAALDTALAETVAPRIARVRLVALDQGNEPLDAPLRWTLTDRETGEVVAAPADAPSIEAELDRGRYLALVGGEAAEGGLPFTIDRLGPQTLEVPVERTAATPPAGTAEAPAAQPEGQALFEETFEDALDPAWTVRNEVADTFVVDSGELFWVASGGDIYPRNETPPNLFLADTPLPEGDFDITVDLKLDAQTGKDQFWFGLFDDAQNYIAADLWMDPGGCGVLPVLSIFKRVNGEETRDDIALLQNSDVDLNICTNERELVDEEQRDLAENGVTLTLSRRGRRLFASVDYTDPRNGEPVRAVTDEVTALRLSGRPFMLLGQYGGVDGETIAQVERFAITRP